MGQDKFEEVDIMLKYFDMPKDRLIFALNPDYIRDMDLRFILDEPVFATSVMAQMRKSRHRILIPDDVLLALRGKFDQVDTFIPIPKGEVEKIYSEAEQLFRWAQSQMNGRVTESKVVDLLSKMREKIDEKY